MNAIFRKIDDVLAFVVLTIFVVFPPVRMVAAFTGNVLVSFDLLMGVLAAGYMVWLVWSDAIPAIVKRDPSEITPLRWLAAFFILPWLVPYFGIRGQVHENAVATSAMLWGLMYAIGAYKYNVRWPKEYIGVLADYFNIARGWAQPLILDALNNNKPNTQERPQGESRKPANPPKVEPAIKPAPAQPVAQKPVAPVQPLQPIAAKPAATPVIEMPATKPAFAATAAPVSIDDLLGEDEADTDKVDLFVRLMKDRQSPVNQAAYALKDGEYRNFGTFTALMREEPARAYQIFVSWVESDRPCEQREAAKKALGL